jgi:C4-dicarboxylate-binding protein DctP
MKKHLLVLFSVLIVLSLCLSGCASGDTSSASSGNAAPSESSNSSDPTNSTQDDYEPFTIRIATAKADTNNQSTSAYELKEYVEAETNGKVTVEVYTNSTLLSEDAMLDGIRGHTADIGVQSTGPYSGYVPEVAVHSLIGVFSSIEDQAAAFEPEDGMLNYVNGLIEEKLGIHTIGMIVDGGTDCLANNHNPIVVAEDAQGLNFRAPNNEIALAISAIGGVPVTLSSSDAYTAIQNGVCDGVFCSSSSFLNNKFNEIVKYATNLPGTPINYINIVVAQDTWESWPESVRALIETKCADLYESTKAHELQADAEEWARIEQTCEVTYLTEEQIQAYLDIIRPAQLEALEQAVSPDSYAKIMEILNKYTF